MTRHNLVLLRRHFDILFGPESLKLHGEFNLEKIFASDILLDIDENYTHKRAGFKSCEEFYHWCSSHHYMDQVITHLHHPKWGSSQRNK